MIMFVCLKKKVYLVMLMQWMRVFNISNKELSEKGHNAKMFRLK